MSNAISADPGYVPGPGGLKTRYGSGVAVMRSMTGSRLDGLLSLHNQHAFALSLECALHTQPREHGSDEPDHVEDHAGRPGLLHQRHDCPPQLEEWRAGSEADQQEQKPDPADPEDEPSALGHGRAQRG